MQHYDIAICWPMVEEFIYGYVLCDTVICYGKITSLSDEVFSTVKNKDVLLMGTYWERETVQKLVDCCASVVVVVYSEKDFNRYYPLPGHCKHLHAETLLCQEHYNQHFWIKPLLTRTRPEGTEQDEEFYRGLLHVGKRMGKTLEEFIPFLVLNDKILSEEKIRQTGATINDSNKMEAKEIVAQHSIECTMKGYRVCLVVGGASPVMPLVMAAASREGVDIGVNVRFYARENITRFTFYTLNEEVDLGFVHDRPFSGGGRKDCKGCTVNGWFESVDALLKFMEATRI